MDTFLSSHDMYGHITQHYMSPYCVCTLLQWRWEHRKKKSWFFILYITCMNSLFSLWTSCVVFTAPCLSALCLLLQPMRPLKATATTSQPVLTIQQVETIFYKIQDIFQIHKEFYDALLPNIQQWDEKVTVGHLFQKLVSRTKPLQSHCVGLCFLSPSSFAGKFVRLSLAVPVNHSSKLGRVCLSECACPHVRVH